MRVIGLSCALVSSLPSAAIAQADAYMQLHVESAPGRSLRAARAVLAARQPALAACGVRSLDPGVEAAETSVAIIVDARGHVRSVDFTPNADGGDAAWCTCAAAALGEATFARAPAETTVRGQLTAVSPTIDALVAADGMLAGPPSPARGGPVRPPRPPPAPEGSVSLSFDFDDSPIAHQVRARSDAIRACYRAGLRSAPRLGGELALHVDADERGHLSVEVVTSSIAAPALEQCVLALIRRSRIAPVSDPEEIATDLTVHFSPPEL